MAIDEELADRLRQALDGIVGISEQKMFGALAFLINGHMIAGTKRNRDGEGVFLFRIGSQNHAEAMAIGHGNPMEMGGRTMHGFYFVDADEVTEEVFDQWKSLALGHAMSLPPKIAKDKQTKPKTSKAKTNKAKFL